MNSLFKIIFLSLVDNLFALNLSDWRQMIGTSRLSIFTDPVSILHEDLVQ